MQGGNRVALTVHKGWAILRLSNPPLGYFDLESGAALLAELEVLETNDEINAVVLTGDQPGVFVRHYDVRVLEARGLTLRDGASSFDIDAAPPESDLHRCIEKIASSRMVYIAAINGMCMGGGLELALACHLRYVQSGEFQLGLPEIQLGLIPGAGGTQRLQAAVGVATSIEMLLLGKCLNPAQAANVGLVHAEVSDANAYASNVAGDLSRRSPAAVAQILRLNAHATGSLREGCLLERIAFAELVKSPYALDAMKQFNEGKRRFPEFP